MSLDRRDTGPLSMDVSMQLLTLGTCLIYSGGVKGSMEEADLALQSQQGSSCSAWLTPLVPSGGLQSVRRTICDVLALRVGSVPGGNCFSLSHQEGVGGGVSLSFSLLGLAENVASAGETTHILQSGA